MSLFPNVLSQITCAVGSAGAALRLRLRCWLRKLLPAGDDADQPERSRIAAAILLAVVFRPRRQRAGRR